MPPCCRPSAAAATALAAVPRVAASRPRATSALRRSGVPRGARRGGAQQRAAAAPAVAAATGRSFASAYTERVLCASDGGGRRGHVGDEVAQEAWEIRHLPPRELAASLVRLRSFLPLRVDALRAALDCPALLAPGAALVAASNLTEISAVVPYSVLVDALIADEPALLADGLTVTRLEQVRGLPQCSARALLTLFVLPGGAPHSLRERSAAAPTDLTRLSSLARIAACDLGRAG